MQLHRTCNGRVRLGGLALYPRKRLGNSNDKCNHDEVNQRRKSESVYMFTPRSVAWRTEVESGRTLSGSGCIPAIKHE